MAEAAPLRAGVVGVGKMGRNHARVYRELPESTLAGIYDADPDRARAVADEYGTEARTLADLLETVDVVSVAVPTEYHYDTARECIDAGVHTLVEKPLVDSPENGRRLVEFADDRGVVLQAGHVERFNPAVRSLAELVSDLDVIAVTARRLGPPIERDVSDTVIMDLMIHDVDILLSLVDSEVADVSASGARGTSFGTATVDFESGVVGQLTASRVTQQKVRELTISATDCRVTVDYIDQSVEIHRQSLPEFVREEGDVRYRHESVIEQVTVDKHEPLKAELSAFVEAVMTGSEPVVSGEDGLRALELTRRIDRLAQEGAATRPPITR